MTNFKLDYSYLPPHMRAGVKGYIEFGQQPGDFLRAVLRNNLMEAALAADDINLYQLHNYARFLYNAPRACWGSEAAINEWITERRAEKSEENQS